MIPIEPDNWIWDWAEPLDEVLEKEEMSTWNYTDFSEEKLKNTKWNIVLFFAATWCPACKSADKNFSSENIPENLNILKLDYDSNTDLRKKYELTSQHTFVQVDNEWNMIKKWMGSRNVEDIVKKIK